MKRRTLLLECGPLNQFHDFFLSSNQFTVGPIKGRARQAGAFLEGHPHVTCNGS